MLPPPPPPQQQQQAVAYSPHLNGEKLTQREGAIAKYDLAEAHADRIKRATRTLFRQLTRLPRCAQLVENLTPDRFSARLHELVTNNLRGFLTEEEDLLENTSNIWKLHNNSSINFSHLVAEPCSADYDPADLKRHYWTNNRSKVLEYGINSNRLEIRVGECSVSATPQEVLNSIAKNFPLPRSRYLKTPKQLRAIYEAARQGETLIKQVQNWKEAEKALNALLNPAE